MKKCVSVAAAAAFVSAALLPAQVGAAPSADLEEVVVTARKRNERLQDLPVSASVVSGEALLADNIRNLESLAALVPTFQYAESVSGNDQVFVRGLGSGVNFGFENTVGQVFNGFYVGRARFGRAAFMDVGQVEILKGPQGAIVGKNTTAGVINTTWARPTSDFSGYLSPTWEFEGDEGLTLQGAVSGPLSDSVRGRLAVRYEDKDGFMYNTDLKEDVTQLKSPAVRGSLEWDVSDSVTAAAVYQYAEQERIGRSYETANCSPQLLALYAPFGEDCLLNYRTSGKIVRGTEELPWSSDTISHFGGITVDWRTGLGTFTSMTGYARFESDDFTGAMTGGLQGNISNFRETYTQYSQEFRLVSPERSKVGYLVGLYYLKVPDQDLDWDLDLNAQGPAPLATTPPAARVRSNRLADQQTETIAAFGELTWNFSERLDLTAGVRHTMEDKEILKRQYQTPLYTETPTISPAPAGPPPATNVHNVRDRIEEEQTNLNFALRWRPSDDVMAYASFASGFKGGGFDYFIAEPQSTILNNIRFAPEKVEAVEVGAKVAFPEQRLRLNAAVFQSRFKDLQVTSLTTDSTSGLLAFRTSNAARAESSGVELDTLWRATDSLTLSFSAAYLDATYSSFPNAPCWEGQTAAQGCTTSPGQPARQNLKGVPLQYSPQWKGALEARYDAPVSDGLRLQLLARAYYSDEYSMQLDNDPVHYQSAYTKVDATIAVASRDGRWRAALVGRNLTDKATSTFANDAGSGSDFFFLEPPRSLALQFTWNFPGSGR
jgi:outer membrane receptor protein involved in Fe transport